MSALSQALFASYMAGGGGGGVDPDFANVSLLCHCDGTNGSTTFTDVIGNTLTPSNSTISTAASQFGGASCKFSSGAFSYVETADSISGLQMGTSDFTAEAFVQYQAGGSGGFQSFFGKRNGSTVVWGLGLIEGVGLGLRLNGSNISFTAMPGGFAHLAITRASGTWTLWVNGSSAFTDSTSVDDTVGRFFWGGISGALENHIGYTDEIRVTKGIARYTSGFTPPAVAFPDS